MTQTLTRSLRAALAATALTASTLAFAPAAFAATAQLRIDDIDLSTEAGRTTLSARIDEAARRACRTQPHTGTRIASREGLDGCMADVRRQIERRLALKVAGESRGR
ncbi:MAG TPA: UrcA family protein [Novosphingobium sp.]|nr:UrcA family protein [Novosphingobium sp.]HMP56927.1 UrcA family protein [Novosphingobium sp.]